MPKIRLADYVMQKLAQFGVSNIYTVTGRGSLYLTDALAKETRLNAICMHHEQAAGYAAVAEASLSGRLAVCLTSTGCGATNAISAVLSAWQDEVPVLFISGQNTLSETTHHNKTLIRTFGEQETDIVALVNPITKASVMLERAEDIANVLTSALQAAMMRRRGPVWLDIPLDLQSSQIEMPRIAESGTTDMTGDSKEAANTLVTSIRSSSRPVILLGAGINHDQAERDVRGFAERYAIPVVYEASAVDVLPATSPSHIGSVGAMGCSRAGNLTIQNADLVIVLGSHLRASTVGDDATSFAREAKVLHFDVDPTQLRPNSPEIAYHGTCNLRQLLIAADELLKIPPFVGWTQHCRKWKAEMPSHPPIESREPTANGLDLYEVVEALGKTSFSNDAVFVTDSGLIELILPTNIELTDEQRVIHPISQGAMGFALPAAVGVSVSSGRQTIVVVGDGSIMMNLQELQTISHNGLPILVIVINNDAYAVIRRRQKELFRTRTIGTDSTNGLSCPNFRSVASAFGFEYRHVGDVAHLRVELDDLAEASKPTLLEIMCRPDQDYVRMARALNSKGKSVARPLEDQYPFLDRAFLRAQMIVNPLNLE